MEIHIRATFFLGLMLLFLSCAKETAIPIQVDFYTQMESNDYSVPVRVQIVNQTKEAETYKWTFEGGSPSSSTDKNPGTIMYNKVGDYTIKLQASNRDGSEGTKEIKITIDANIVVDFDLAIEDNNFSPMLVGLTNATKEASVYQWTFEGGDPSYSAVREPGQIIFKEPGKHKIILEASNGRETKRMVKEVTVAPSLIADFDFDVAFEDDDLQVPVTMIMVNTSTSATDYEWRFYQANPALSAMADPTITIDAPGTHTLELKASNGKETQTVSKNITVFPNTNLRTFTNVQLGINTAHNSNMIGSYFSTIKREVYKRGDIPMDEESTIDIAFFGLNPDFTFNKFVSPDQVQEYTFKPIANANHTKFINLQEFCECTASLSPAEFDAMEDDSILKEMTIEETIGGIQDFDNSEVPRVVLFETGDGRKGAIKINEFVQDGLNSFIIVDIKVQKDVI